MDVKKVQKDLGKIVKSSCLAIHYIRIGDDKGVEYELQAIEGRIAKIRNEIFK